MKRLIITGLTALTLCVSSCKESNSDDDERITNTDSLLLEDENSINTSNPSETSTTPSQKNTVEPSEAMTSDSQPQGVTSIESKTIKPPNTPSSTTFRTSVLTASSITMYDNSGKQEPIRFGQAAQDVITRVNRYLGSPSKNVIESNCTGASVRKVEWEEHLTLLFTTGGTSTLAGWSLQARDSNATKFKTTNGITVGTKFNSAIKSTKTALGYLQQSESINAIFPEDDSSATATYVFAGVNCYALNQGATPESEKN